MCCQKRIKFLFFGPGKGKKSQILFLCVLFNFQVELFFAQSFLNFHELYSNNFAGPEIELLGRPLVEKKVRKELYQAQKNWCNVDQIWKKDKAAYNIFLKNIPAKVRASIEKKGHEYRLAVSASEFFNFSSSSFI